MNNKALHPRHQRHRQIRLLVEDGQLDQAVLEFRTAIQDYGPHVGLLCDLAGCYYEMGRYQECWRTLQYLENELLMCEGLLSRDSGRRTFLMLAKFQEEAAEPARALNSLQRAFEYCDSQDDKKWIQLQELRIHSYFGNRKDLSGKYLTILEKIRSDENLKIETLHALLWTDWALFGFVSAERRWQQVLTLKLNVLDLRLISRDFVEICHLSNINDSESFLRAKDILSTGSLLDYDKCLLRSGDDISEMGLSNTDLSPMMRLRLLFIALHGKSSSANKEVTYKNLLFLINGLSRESKELFNKLLPSPESSVLKVLVLDESYKRMRLNGTNESLKLTTLQAKFLKALMESENVPLEFLSQAIWGEAEAGESIYHRLRMIVYKLNETLYLRLGFTPFEIKKDGVIRHPDLKIKI